MPARPDPYADFLREADLGIWRDCLCHYDDLLATPRPGAAAQGQRLAEALCIAIYSGWLASKCGETAAGEEATRRLATLSDRAMQAPHDGALGGRLRALVAHGKGYSALARDALGPIASPLPPEIALLVVPEAPAQSAALLRPYLAAGGARPFLPVFHFYARALLDLGYLDEVRSSLQAFRFAEDNALWIDLQGKLLELSGAWHEARDAYRRSAWVAHRYRSVVCGIIGGEGGDTLAQTMQHAQQLKLAMLQSGSEINQAEVARCEAFVNACRWSEFDNWLVSYERGALCFRRRRHAEAERHLEAAAAHVPAQFAFAVHQLRFTNLSWLTDVLDVEPEALECAHAALSCPGDERSKAGIRTYLGRKPGARALLEPVFASGNLAEMGTAYALRGDLPRALHSWCAAVGEGFDARAFHPLLRHFAAFGFEHTVLQLAQLAMRENWDSFFELWELAGVLLELQPPDAGGGTGAPLAQALQRASTRLQQLAEPEFQHLMRAFAFFWRMRRIDVAAELLGRAERLAESPEEYLQLAAARRKTGAAGREVLGLAHLMQAERASGDRLERLQVAREYAAYRQVARARRILRAEGLLDGEAVLQPLQYILALQCGEPCLSPEETKRLRDGAAARLDQDLQAGRYPTQGVRFADRLRRHAAGAAFEFRSLQPSGMPTAAARDQASIWQSFTERQKRLQDYRLFEDELDAVRDRLAASAAGDDGPFLRYALWGHVKQQHEELLEAIKRVRPEVAEARTPISRGDTILVNPRSQRLSQLWRSYLGAGAAQQAEHWRELQAFELEERELEQQWQAMRDRATEGLARRARDLAWAARDILLAMRTQEQQASPWPALLGLREALLLDIGAQLARLKQPLP